MWIDILPFQRRQRTMIDAGVATLPQRFSEDLLDHQGISHQNLQLLGYDHARNRRFPFKYPPASPNSMEPAEEGLKARVAMADGGSLR